MPYKMYAHSRQFKDIRKDISKTETSGSRFEKRLWSAAAEYVTRKILAARPEDRAGHRISVKDAPQNVQVALLRMLLEMKRNSVEGEAEILKYDLGGASIYVVNHVTAYRDGGKTGYTSEAVFLDRHGRQLGHMDSLGIDGSDFVPRRMEFHAPKVPEGQREPSGEIIRSLTRELLAYSNPGHIDVFEKDSASEHERFVEFEKQYEDALVRSAFRKMARQPHGPRGPRGSHT
jgi:hypothetical protein